MIRHPALHLLTLSAALSLVLTGCSDESPEATSEPSASTSSPIAPATEETSSQAPFSLKNYEGTISPGKHRVPLISWDRTYPLDALVDVPAGFITPGGWVVENGENGTAYGDLMFFGDVDRVDTRPCGQGRDVKPGPSVGELTAALISQVPSRFTAPTPVTVGGHSGLYVETTTPRHPASCAGGEFRMWGVTSGEAFWYSVNQPGTVVHVWIVDVEGQRVAMAVKEVPGSTVKTAKLLRMAETAQFVKNEKG